MKAKVAIRELKTDFENKKRSLFFFYIYKKALLLPTPFREKTD
jgi:hypothetical protein